jgi:hypothetical protein
MRFSRTLAVAGIMVLGMTVGAAPCKAGFFTSSGINAETGDTVAGSAVFKISGDTLTITLKNTTLGGTLLRGDILTGLVWDINSATPVLAFPTTSLTMGSETFTEKTTSTTSEPVNGSWTNVLGATPISQYGVATTGFGGAFSSGTITLGTGGVDYGIISNDPPNGTFPAPPGSGTSGSFNASAFPLTQDTLTFTLTGISGVSESQISNVKLLFGTEGTGIITTTVVTTTVVPEPGTFTVIGIGLGAAGLVGLRRVWKGFPMNSRLLFCMLLLASGGTSATWGGTTLTFDPGAAFSDGTAPPGDYGDRVASSPQGGFEYGGAADTPNVVIDYENWSYTVFSAPLDPSGQDRSPGLLRGAFTNGNGTITFTADPGFLVTLHSFYVIATPFTGGVDVGVEGLSVTGGISDFSLTHFNAPTFTPIIPEVTGQVLTLTILFNVFVGIDNIEFSQSRASQTAIPESSSFVVSSILCGLFGVIGLRKRLNNLAV